MTDVSLGDKVKITNWPQEEFDGREGVVAEAYPDKTVKIAFDDGEFPKKGRFARAYLTHHVPEFPVGSRVVYQNTPAVVTKIKTYAAPNSNRYTVKFPYGGTHYNISADELVTAPDEAPKRFAIGQKVRYIGNGDGVFPEYQQDGVVTRYTDAGAVCVTIEGVGFVTHREHDIEAILEEGMELKRGDLRLGMEVRVEYTTTNSGYTQTSAKQGVIGKINEFGIPYTKIGENQYIALHYYGVPYTYTLIKNAPKVDPHVATVEALEQGSVVQFWDNGSNNTYTYVKSSKPNEWWGLSGGTEPITVSPRSVVAALKQDNVRIISTNEDKVK
jgi:hypothetical protein